MYNTRVSKMYQDKPAKELMSLKVSDIPCILKRCIDNVLDKKTIE